MTNLKAFSLRMVIGLVIVFLIWFSIVTGLIFIIIGGFVIFLVGHAIVSLFEDNDEEDCGW